MSLLITLGTKQGFYFYHKPGYSYRLALGIIVITLITQAAEHRYTDVLPEDRLPEWYTDPANLDVLKADIYLSLQKFNEFNAVYNQLTNYEYLVLSQVREYADEMATENRERAALWKKEIDDKLYNYSRGRAFSYEEIIRFIDRREAKPVPKDKVIL